MTRQRAVNSFDSGINFDINPLTMPPNTLADCVNGTLITYNGDEMILQNDAGNIKIQVPYEHKTTPDGDDEFVELKQGFYPIGMKEFGGVLYIVSAKSEVSLEDVPEFDSDNWYDPDNYVYSYPSYLTLASEKTAENRRYYKALGEVFPGGDLLDDTIWEALGGVEGFYNDSSLVEIGTYPSPEASGEQSTKSNLELGEDDDWGVEDSELYTNVIANQGTFRAGSYIKFVGTNEGVTNPEDDYALFTTDPNLRQTYRMHLNHMLERGIIPLTEDVWEKYRDWVDRVSSNPDIPTPPHWASSGVFKYYCPHQFKGKLAAFIDYEPITLFNLVDYPTISRDSDGNYDVSIEITFSNDFALREGSTEVWPEADSGILVKCGLLNVIDSSGNIVHIIAESDTELVDKELFDTLVYNFKLSSDLYEGETLYYEINPSAVIRDLKIGDQYKLITHPEFSKEHLLSGNFTVATVNSVTEGVTIRAEDNPSSGGNYSCVRELDEDLYPWDERRAILHEVFLRNEAGDYVGLRGDPVDIEDRFYYAHSGSGINLEDEKLLGTYNVTHDVVGALSIEVDHFDSGLPTSVQDTLVLDAVIIDGISACEGYDTVLVTIETVDSFPFISGEITSMQNASDWAGDDPVDMGDDDITLTVNGVATTMDSLGATNQFELLLPKRESSYLLSLNQGSDVGEFRPNTTATIWIELDENGDFIGIGKKFIWTESRDVHLIAEDFTGALGYINGLENVSVDPDTGDITALNNYTDTYVEGGVSQGGSPYIPIAFEHPDDANTHIAHIAFTGISTEPAVTLFSPAYTTFDKVKVYSKEYDPNNPYPTFGNFTITGYDPDTGAPEYTMIEALWSFDSWASFSLHSDEFLNNPNPRPSSATLQALRKVDPSATNENEYILVAINVIAHLQP